MAEAPTATFNGALLVQDTAATGIWRLDPAQSRVEFAVKHHNQCWKIHNDFHREA